MKNYFLALLGAILVAIVFADWNTATWQVNAILGAFGVAAFLVGIFSSWRLSPQFPPAFMARHVGDEVPPRGASRWGRCYKS